MIFIAVVVKLFLIFEEREKLESFAQRNWSKEIKKEEIAVKGWNWGKPDFKGAHFHLETLLQQLR